VAALIVLAAVILIQQLEGHLVFPVVVGRALDLHPVAILLALTAGGVLGGVAGALLAVPLAAVVSSAASYPACAPDRARARAWKRLGDFAELLSLSEAL
jgi:predicted PurR-regulated permease PerM